MVADYEGVWECVASSVRTRALIRLPCSISIKKPARGGLFLILAERGADHLLFPDVRTSS